MHSMPFKEDVTMTKTADVIRNHGRDRYVLPARNRRLRQFSIRAGDVVRELKLLGRVPAVCSALKSHAFLGQNGLRLVQTSGPSSGQSTTVTYTYEFLEAQGSPASSADDPWAELRGALKPVFAELGGGESYLLRERANFYLSKENE
jgi:hypothetical protein